MSRSSILLSVPHLLLAPTPVPSAELVSPVEMAVPTPLPKGIVENTDQVYAEVASLPVVPIDQIRKYWHGIAHPSETALLGRT